MRSLPPRRKCTPVREAEQSGDVRHSLADVSQAAAALVIGPPFVDLHEGLAQMIACYE